MGTPYLSEIRIFSFSFAPKGWAFCNGQTLPINQNQALFSLMGTTYGGNGQTTFQLPNLQGRVPMYVGHGHVLGEVFGETAHTLATTEMPTHTHSLEATSNDAASAIPSGSEVLGAASNLYVQTSPNLVPLNGSSVASVGGSQPHENMQPYLTLNFCIALQGIFPSRN
jgi:microcystin-dependent protein